MKRSEKTASRKPAKWRGSTKESLIYLFFSFFAERGKVLRPTRRAASLDESNKYIFGVPIKSLTVNKRDDKISEQ